MEKRKEAIKDDLSAHFINAVAYEIRPDRYSPEKFEVFIGCGAVEPAIVNSEEHKLLLIKGQNLKVLDKRRNSLEKFL